MSREEYVSCIQDLLSRDPARIRDANRRLFGAVVDSWPSHGDSDVGQDAQRSADLVLAEVAG